MCLWSQLLFALRLLVTQRFCFGFPVSVKKKKNLVVFSTYDSGMVVVTKQEIEMIESLYLKLR